MANPYYDPEELGLELVTSVDFGESYEFDIVAIWRHKETGVMYYATDSGCSCPTPFENYHSVADLNVLNTQTVGEFRSLVESQYNYDARKAQPLFDVTP